MAGGGPTCEACHPGGGPGGALGEATRGGLCHPGGGPGGVLGEAIGRGGGDAGHAIGVGGVFGKEVELRSNSSGVSGSYRNSLLGGGVLDIQ